MHVLLLRRRPVTPSSKSDQSYKRNQKHIIVQNITRGSDDGI